jgi:hypothetical protein
MKAPKLRVVRVGNEPRRPLNKWGHPKCSVIECQKPIYFDGLCYSHVQDRAALQSKDGAA